MQNSKPLVKASGARFGKAILGGFQVAYHCPRCRAELVTKNQEILLGDTCPHCRTTYEFDALIREAFLGFDKQTQDREEQKRAAQMAKEQEQVRARVAQMEQAKQERVEQWRRSQARRDKDAAAATASKRKFARDLDADYGCLLAVLVVCALGVALTFFGSLIPFFNNDRFDDSVGWMGIVAVVSAAISLFFVWLFFRVLRAIHMLLVQILDRLPQSGEQTEPTPDFTESA